MATNIDELIEKESAETQAYIAKRTQEIVQEVLSLSEIRKLVGRTQATMAEEMCINQQNISKIENRKDLMLSTLKNYIECLGGTLNITAVFPDNKEISLNKAILRDQNKKPHAVD